MEVTQAPLLDKSTQIENTNPINNPIKIQIISDSASDALSFLKDCLCGAINVIDTSSYYLLSGIAGLLITVLTAAALVVMIGLGLLMTILTVSIAIIFFVTALFLALLASIYLLIDYSSTSLITLIDRSQGDLREKDMAGKFLKFLQEIEKTLPNIGKEIGEKLGQLLFSDIPTEN